MVGLKTKQWLTGFGLITLLNVPAALAVDTISDFHEAITQTVLTNPEVSAALYDFEASREEQRVARGGYLPKLDLIAEIGSERSRTPIRSSDSYTRDSTRLVLTQMLFDGFATRNDVDRLDHTKRVRYYELKSTSEESALGAAQAYLDVLRQQRLVKLAEENYIQHQRIFNDIKKRVTAGVSRRVDLEQANARSSLAATNLLTETSNLYDVTVRFQRIVGALPAEHLSAPIIPVNAIPKTRLDTLHRAYATNPQLAAAIENILGAQADLRGKKAAMFPRFDLRLRQELDNDTDGITGSYKESAVEVVMTYNLYNGGSDRARQRQFHQRLNTSRELHEKACRDVRQLVSIAHNDIQALTEQVMYLNQNQISVGKARQSYRKQFDIGQRSLLDLLDTENEYFNVRRSYVNASQDLLLAQVRTLAAMGLLMESLNVSGLSNEALKKMDSQDHHNSEHRCPQEVVLPKIVNRQELLSNIITDYRFRITADGALAFRMNVGFATGNSKIQDQYNKDILDAAQFLKKSPAMTGVIEGHTDNRGSESYNMELSLMRAQAVYDSLVNNYDIDPHRLSTRGYGLIKPIDDNATVAGRKNNRRVELVIP